MYLYKKEGNIDFNKNKNAIRDVELYIFCCFDEIKVYKKEKEGLKGFTMRLHEN